MIVRQTESRAEGDEGEGVPFQIQEWQHVDRPIWIQWGTWFCKQMQENLYPHICNVGLKWKWVIFWKHSISLSPTSPVM